jgi:hypothetical protein
MVMKPAILLIIYAALLLGIFTSCLEDPIMPMPICSDEYVWGLEIRLVDEESGQPAGRGASVIVRDGKYEENRIAEDFGSLGVATLAAGERPGIYDIVIEAEGFKKWTRDNVIVLENSCHVIQVKILAELERDGS